MANSYETYTGNGVTQNYNVSFPYLDRSHVKVFLNNVETFAYTWINTSQIGFTTAPANGATILIKRVTPASPLVDFTARSRWQTSDLNLATKQSLYIAQEADENTNQWLTGNGAPSDTIGNEGDYYYNIATGGLHRKGSASWSFLCILGVAGLPGIGTGDMLKAVYDTTNDGIIDQAASVPWTGITGRPSTFPPSTHAHIISDVTNLQTSLNGKADLAGDNTFAGNQVFNGTVGIGTASPAERLHMSNGNVRFDGDASNPTNGVYVRATGANASTQRIVFYNGDNENGIPIGGFTLGLLTNGGSTVSLDYTPPGARTTDRRRSAVYASGSGTSGEVVILGARQFNSDNGRIVLVAEGNDANQSSFIQIEHRSITGAGQWYAAFRHNNNTIGTITQVGTSGVAYNTSSDYRLKENFEPVTGALTRCNSLPVWRFNFIGDDKTFDGFKAHEAQLVVPEAVTGHKDEVDENGNPVYQGIDQSKLVPLLFAAVQELSAQVTSLTARVEALEAAQ
jgi:hypothetical protein